MNTGVVEATNASMFDASPADADLDAATGVDGTTDADAIVPRGDE
jgi:hypothetical protein